MYFKGQRHGPLFISCDLCGTNQGCCPSYIYLYLSKPRVPRLGSVGAPSSLSLTSFLLDSGGPRQAWVQKVVPAIADCVVEEPWLLGGSGRGCTCFTGALVALKEDVDCFVPSIPEIAPIILDMRSHLWNLLQFWQLLFARNRLQIWLP